MDRSAKGQHWVQSGECKTKGACALNHLPSLPSHPSLSSQQALTENCAWSQLHALLPGVLDTTKAPCTQYFIDNLCGHYLTRNHTRCWEEDRSKQTKQASTHKTHVFLLCLSTEVLLKISQLSLALTMETRIQRVPSKYKLHCPGSCL